MARYLVTGGCGFIGSHLVDRLLQDGHVVHVLDNLSTGLVKNLPTTSNRLSLCQGDIRNHSTVRKAMQDTDGVFHLAARPSVAFSLECPEETVAVNVLGSLNVLDVARQLGIETVILASSSSVYGNIRRGATCSSEDDKVTPRSPYAASKLSMETMASVYSHCYGMRTPCLRFFNVYGPRQRHDSAYAAVIPLFVRAVQAGKPLEIHGDGQQMRSFCHVSDVVQACVLAERKEEAAGPINIGGSVSVAVADLAEMIAAASARCGVELKRMPPRQGDVRFSMADLSRAAALLGWYPKMALEVGLEMLCR